MTTSPMLAGAPDGAHVQAGTSLTRFGEVDGEATFSRDGTYRFLLRRAFRAPGLHATKGVLAFVMLNPSTADAQSVDPTVNRCLGYAWDWGYRELFVGNLFALRATDPRLLYAHPAPIGAGNDDVLLNLARRADLVVLAWGAHGKLHHRGALVRERLAREVPQKLAVLDTTQSGEPRHPLYLESACAPTRLYAEAEA